MTIKVAAKGLMKVGTKALATKSLPLGAPGKLLPSVLPKTAPAALPKFSTVTTRTLPRPMATPGTLSPGPRPAPRNTVPHASADSGKKRYGRGSDKPEHTKGASKSKEGKHQKGARRKLTQTQNNKKFKKGWYQR